MNNPAMYIKSNALMRGITEDLLNEFIDEIGNMSGRCIDVGSGPGDVLADLILPKLNDKATIVGSDISEKMVNFGNEKYRDNERMSFVQLDIESANLPGHLVGQFDHVTSFYCIHWCQDIPRVFENIFSLLQPGGTFFITFISKSPFLSSYKILAAMPRYAPYMKDADRYVPAFQDVEQPDNTLRALLTDIGFEVQHCSVRDKYWIFRTREDFHKFALTLNPFIDRMPSHLKEEYEKDLVREAAEKYIDINENINKNGDYSITTTHHIFVLHCKKPKI